MLMRKRAWDIMRDDYTRITEESGLISLISVLRDAVQQDSDNHIAVVFDKNKRVKGVITMWDVMKRLEQSVFSDEIMLNYDDDDWDKAFARACRACAAKGIDGLLQEDVPVVQPNDPLVVVIDAFLDYRRGWALVKDGDKVLGVIFKSDIFHEVSRDVLKHTRVE